MRTWIRHTAYVLLILSYVVIGVSGTSFDWGLFARKDHRICGTTKARSPGPAGCKAVWTQHKHVATSVRIDASHECTTGDTDFSAENTEFGILNLRQRFGPQSPFLHPYNPRSPPAA